MAQSIKEKIINELVSEGFNKDYLESLNPFVLASKYEHYTGKLLMANTEPDKSLILKGITNLCADLLSDMECTDQVILAKKILSIFFFPSFNSPLTKQEFETELPVQILAGRIAVIGEDRTCLYLSTAAQFIREKGFLVYPEDLKDIY